MDYSDNILSPTLFTSAANSLSDCKTRITSSCEVLRKINHFHAVIGAETCRDVLDARCAAGINSVNG